MIKKSQKFEGMTAREIAMDAIQHSIPRLQTEEEAGWTEEYENIESLEVASVRKRWNTPVPGSLAPDQVIIGAIQAVSNQGRDVTEAEKLIVPTQKAYEENDDATLMENVALIFHHLANAPKIENDPYWDYQQFGSFEDYESSVKFEDCATLDIEQEEFIERVHAAWTTQIAGGGLGTMLEGYTTDNLRKTFGEITGYLRQPSTHNDDILFELALIDAVAENGYAVSSNDIALKWVGNISYTWSAEEIALKNLRRGIMPPESARLNNPWNEWIGAQMRGSVCGLVCPGNAREAARLAWLDGRISHVNNGILGEVFNAILTAEAWNSKNVREILYKTISLIPKKSQYYSVIDFAIKACEENSSWEPAWRKCEEEYRHYNWIHAYPNAAAEVVALYFAEEDFDECMHIIAMCGQDVDCNAGQIATIYGIIHGFEGIDARWSEPFNDEFYSLYRGYEDTTIKRIAENTYKAYKAYRNEK
uniref:ADP-ribosylglycohydrolase family protein n=1 Tax=Ndongobacter massiliensis TaxID=1871025 RepID=UPI0009F80E1E|nr:ADP-ribosylglycohydrolase family protein [Ndongobacter massiliensis]